MKEGKLKTPVWILEGYKSKEEYEKKKGIKSKGSAKEKTYKIKTCPKCGNAEIRVVLGGEEGRGSNGWECKSCGWKGKQTDEKELGEDEFMVHLDKMEGR